MNRKRNHILTFILIIMIIACGFVRDFLFRYLSAQINPDENIEYLKSSGAGDIFINISQNGFYALKWYLTILFTLIYLFLSGLIFYNLVGKKKHIGYLTGFYCLSIILSAALIITGLLTGNYSDCYRLSHSFIRILQSPVPLIIFIAASYLLKTPE